MDPTIRWPQGGLGARLATALMTLALALVALLGAAATKAEATCYQHSTPGASTVMNASEYRHINRPACGGQPSSSDHDGLATGSPSVITQWKNEVTTNGGGVCTPSYYWFQATNADWFSASCTSNPFGGLAITDVAGQASLTPTSDPSRIIADARSWRDCLIQQDVVFKPIGGGESFPVGDAAARASCGYIAAAGAAATAIQTASLEAKFLRVGAQPMIFWTCLAADGWDLPMTPGGTRRDFQSPDFGADARSCALAAGTDVPSLTS